MPYTDKIIADAQRASGRGPASYIADRVLSRADFRKPANTGMTGNDTSRPSDDMNGQENGATRVLRHRMDSQENDALGKDKYKKGGLVRRGYGKARGA